MSYITVLCVQGIPILSPLLFVPSLYSTLFNLLVICELDMVTVYLDMYASWYIIIIMMIYNTACVDVH